MRKLLPLLAIAGLLLASAGCKSGAPKDPILRLSAEESLATGKDLLATEIYRRSNRGKGPFIALNCAESISRSSSFRSKGCDRSVAGKLARRPD